jgi:glycosyltransferase involved in cell wall biosynthesis
MERFLLRIMRTPVRLLPRRLRNRLRLWRDARAVRRSGLFSEAFYLRQNPDVAAAGADPILHYLTNGHAEGRNPGDRFDAAHYLEANADVARAGLNPLVHYMRHGQREGRVIRSVAGQAGNLTHAHEWFPHRRPGIGSYLRTAIMHPREGGRMVRKVFSIFRKEGWCGIRRRFQYAAPPHRTTFVDRFPAVSQSEPRFFPAKPITVSAVVVCYNHERYLAQRLQSILNQTHPPDEIIFLDDASSDSSVKIAHSIASRSPVPFKFVLNEQNSGSPFAQWIRGIETACSDLVWIAEGDDFSDRQFLENLVPAFFDPDVAMAYAQSAPVDENGRLHGPDYRDYTADLSATRWDSAHTNDGISEIRDFLAIKNTIPNASAVVMRRIPVSSIPKDLQEFRFAGDWYFYVHLLQAGKISFVPTLLNFHRRHGQTVTSAIERDDQAIIEQLRVKIHILEKFQLPINTITSTIAQTVSEYYRLDELHSLSRVAFTDNPAFQSSICRLRELCKSALAGPVGGKTLLFVIGDAEMGGGQVAGVRLANELSINHRVFLCNARPEAVDPDFITRVGSNVVLLEGTRGFVEWAAQSRSAEHQRNRISEGKRRVAVVRELLRFHQIDLIVSHIWWADRFTFAVNRDMRLPWFIQMHGCYEALAQNPDWDSEFSDLVRPLMALVTGVCYLTPRNLRIFELGKALRPKRLRQFFNGLNPMCVPKSAERSRLIRSADEFVFCLCSRAIRDKGWDEAITATIKINALSPELRSWRRARLLLIGDSEYAKSLKAKYAQQWGIEFLGQLPDPLPTIFVCDVGLLPSRFVSESVPSSVIEYLACGKPVIATTIGSIPQMIAREGREAGLLIPYDLPQTAFVDALYDAMLRYMTDCALREEHRSNASIVFDGQFNLERVAAEYLAFFTEATRAGSTASAPHHGPDSAGALENQHAGYSRVPR